MTIRYEITKRFRRKKLIPKCIYPNCHMVRDGDKWVEYKGHMNYKNFTGSLCESHLEESLKYNKIERTLLMGTLK